MLRNIDRGGPRAPQFLTLSSLYYPAWCTPCPSAMKAPGPFSVLQSSSLLPPRAACFPDFQIHCHFTVTSRLPVNWGNPAYRSWHVNGPHGNSPSMNLDFSFGASNLPSPFMKVSPTSNLALLCWPELFHVFMIVFLLVHFFLSLTYSCFFTCFFDKHILDA